MPHKRGPWSTSEDANLLTLVHHHGPQNWVRISQHLGSRSPKQCRERYHQNLKPTLNHSPITPQEGELIETLVKQIGRRWADISRRLPGRSDNAVKNWWNGGVNRRRRVVVRRDGLGKPSRNPITSGRSFLSTQIAALADQRTLPTSLSQIPKHAPLMSPVRSEVSMPDSMGEAPSLVSDHGSQQTIPSPGGYSRILHMAPNAGAVTPGLWYHGSALSSSMPSQTLSSQHNLTPPVISPLADRFDSTSTRGRLHHLSEIAANEDLLPTTKYASSPFIDNALKPQPTNSHNDTAIGAEHPPNKLHDARNRLYGGVASDEESHRLRYDPLSLGRQSFQKDGRSVQTTRGTLAMAGDMSAPADCRLDVSLLAPKIPQPSLERRERKESPSTGSTTDTARCLKTADHILAEPSDARKNKMTLSSILL